jgi:hypothetical protein
LDGGNAVGQTDTEATVPVLGAVNGADAVWFLVACGGHVVCAAGVKSGFVSSRRTNHSLNVRDTQSI